MPPKSVLVMLVTMLITSLLVVVIGSQFTVSRSSASEAVQRRVFHAVAKATVSSQVERRSSNQTAAPRLPGTVATKKNTVSRNRSWTAVAFEPCECADPATAFSDKIRKRCDKRWRQRYIFSPPGLKALRDYVDVTVQIALIDELEQFKFRPYFGKDCVEMGMNFSFYVSESASATLSPHVLALAKQLVADGLLPEEPNYALINRYDAGSGIHPHVDDVFYTDTVASVTIGSGAALEFAWDGFAAFFQKPENQLLRDERKQQLQYPLSACASGFFAPGAVFSMTGEARWGWKHEMKRRATDAVLAEDLPHTAVGRAATDSMWRRRIDRNRRYAITFRRVKDDVMKARWKGATVRSDAYS